MQEWLSLILCPPIGDTEVSAVVGPSQLLAAETLLYWMEPMRILWVGCLWFSCMQRTLQLCSPRASFPRVTGRYYPSRECLPRSTSVAVLCSSYKATALLLKPFLLHYVVLQDLHVESQDCQLVPSKTEARIRPELSWEIAEGSQDKTSPRCEEWRLEVTLSSKPWGPTGSLDPSPLIIFSPKPWNSWLV